MVATALTQNKDRRGDFKSPDSEKSKQPESEDKLKRILSFGSKRTAAGARILSNERSLENKKKLNTSGKARIPVSPQSNVKGTKCTLVHFNDKKDRNEKDNVSLNIHPKDKGSRNIPILNKPLHNFKSTPFINKFPLSSSN
jgi:hypothetical protein